MSKKPQRRSQTASCNGMRVDLVGMESPDGKTEVRMREIRTLITKLILSASRRGRPKKYEEEESYAA